MAEVFGERRKALEEDYFRKKEQELVAKLRARATEDAEKRRLAEAVGEVDEEILAILLAMGLDRESVTLLHLIPVLEVAWSDGAVSRQERDGILALARARRIAEGSAADQRLGEWLASRPDAALFERARRVIHDLLAGMADADRGAVSRDLVAACEAIAQSSGGFLGLGARTSTEERSVIERVAAQVQRAHEAAARRVTGSL